MQKSRRKQTRDEIFLPRGENRSGHRPEAIFYRARRKVREKSGIEDDLRNFSGTPTLEKIFDLYDAMVFRGRLRKKLAEAGAQVFFLPTTDLTESQKPHSVHGDFGSCSCISDAYSYTFSFGIELYLALFSTDAATKIRAFRVNGLLAKTRLEILLLVFEHEICHLIMMLWGYDEKVTSDPDVGTGVYSSHGEMFARLVQHFFGHTDVKHRIFFGDALEKHLTFEDTRVGDPIIFVEPGMPDRDGLVRKNGVVKKVGASVVRVETSDGERDMRWELTRSRS